MPSIALPVSLRGQLLSGVRFSPDSLFVANEPGVWYDPSDVANLNWRRNLLTWTEQFDNAIWTLIRGGTVSTPVRTVNFGAAPDGTMTACRLQITAGAATGAGDFGLLRQNIPGFPPSETFTSSIWMRSNTGANQFVTLRYNPGASAVVQVTPTWQRFVVVDGSGAASFDVGVRGDTTANGNLDILIWRAQAELGSVATDYQRITDVNTEVLERFPTATLFTDTAGTTPVTTPGQTVALALDKSKGLVLGPELVTNGDFSSGSTGWTLGTGWSISSGVASCNGTNTAASNLVQPNILTDGKVYQVRFTLSGYSAGSVRVVLGGNGPGPFVSGNGTYTQIITTVNGASPANLNVQANIGFVGSIDNISVRELPGFHATQATAASRPTYGIVPRTGRRNLLTRTEEFDNAAWAKFDITVTPNNAVAPDGTLTADTLIGSTANSVKTVVQTGLPSTVGTFTVYAKAAGETVISLWLVGASVGASFTLTGAGSTTLLGVTSSSITLVGDGWYRCQVYHSSATTTAHIYLRTGTTGYVGDGVSGVRIWGAQLETGSSATSYQKVTTAFDVTEAGVPSLSYLSFDGVDDFLVTPTITPGVDKVQVFAGVRKLSDASTGMLLETGVGGIGTIYVTAPNAPNQITFRTGGSTLVPVNATLTGSVPFVVSGIGDIANDVSRIRINGGSDTTSSGDQGTGNYAAQPLYIGRRNGSTLPFNGNLFSLIIRFGANLDANTITNTETWVNGKTGAY